MQLIEPATAEQELGVAIGGFPFAHRLGEATLVADIVTGSVDPSAEPSPFGEQRLVRDLHGRPPSHRISIEAQQPVSTEHVEDAVQLLTVDAELVELGLQNPTASVAGPFAERDESQEHDAGAVARLGPEAGEQALGPLHERTRHAPQLAIGGIGDESALSSIEEFGQGVLQQRQRSRSIGNVSHQLRDERRFERHAERFHRADDRSLDLLGRHRRDHLGALAQQFAESAMLQRPIVEIGAQRDDHVGATVLVDDGVHQRIDEPVGSLGVGLGEQFLELIDHEEQLRAVGGQHAPHRVL